MSGPIASSNRAADSAGSKRGTLAWMARFLPILTMVGFTLSMVPNSGCGKGIFPEVTGSATATTVPTTTTTATATTPTATATTPTSTATAQLAPAKAFSMRGSGTQATPIVGTCSGAGCGGSTKHCECLQFTGTLLSTEVGNSNWTANITVNEDDCTSTGTSGGLCCVGDGTFDATSSTGKAVSDLSFSVTGPICMDPNTSSDPLTLDSSLAANFEVLNSTSTGKFKDAVGTGQINIFTDVATGNSYLAVLGELQLGK